MRRILFTFYIFAGLMIFALPVMAQDKEITVDLASDHVDITTGFNGTRLQLFGVRHDKGDLAVIVRGPIRTMSVRKKESVLGAWINRSFETFKGVPSYYNYALSAPLDKIASPEILKKYGIGTENLQFNKPDSVDEKRETFRSAMIRNKQNQRLFAREPEEISFINPDFFRADFYIPSNVPVGEYEVQAIYLTKGVVQDIQTKTVRVAQVGVAANLHEFAYKNSLMYGAVCVILALFAGWFSNRVRRG